MRGHTHFVSAQRMRNRRSLKEKNARFDSRDPQNRDLDSRFWYGNERILDFVHNVASRHRSSQCGLCGFSSQLTRCRMSKVEPEIECRKSISKAEPVWRNGRALPWQNVELRPKLDQVEAGSESKHANGFRFYVPRSMKNCSRRCAG